MGAIKLFDSLTPVYYWNKLSDKKIKVNQGGTNSGKTYGIMQAIIDRLCRNENWTATVTAESWPTLERGALRDFKSIIRNSPILRFYIPNHKLKKGPFKFFNGSTLEFVTVKNPLDARHGKRQILFVNEANAMSYDTVEEMVIRSNKDVFIDYNPNSRFWVHDLYQGKKHVDFFISNFRHNQYCPVDVKRNIGMYYTEWKRREAEGDLSYKYWRNKFRVYGLGLTGIVQGVVFENVYYRPTFPMDCRKKTYVIDWGYTNDPLAMALCGVNQGNIYGKELIYEREMTTPRLIKRMEALNINKNDLIVADNSNWDGIGQLRDAGYNVVPAHKPPNSRKTGVNLLLGYNIWLTEDSRNWKKEQENYKYKKINGTFTDEPQDGDDHLWDCLRYYGQTVLVKNKPKDKKRTKRKANL